MDKNCAPLSVSILAFVAGREVENLTWDHMQLQRGHVAESYLRNLYLKSLVLGC